MALERINPFEREDRFCLDHLLRYTWAKELICGKRVMDVACGLGFGTAMLAKAGASSVVGVDIDKEAISKCSEWWDQPNISFQQGTIEQLANLELAGLEAVVCFETLEHVKDPRLAVSAIKSVLSAGGILIGSVPGESDAKAENEFHLQHFDERQLESLLREHFDNIRLYKQRFHLGSIIEQNENEEASPVRDTNLKGVEIGFGSANKLADSIVFLASDAELPGNPGTNIGYSRQAWLGECEEITKMAAERSAAHAKFQDLFLEHGELQRKFTSVLGWGKYNYAKANGKEPEEHYLAAIENAQSAREIELRAQVKQLQEEAAILKRKLAESGNLESDHSKANRKAFEQIL